MPRHVNPADGRNTATAPYNFVPLPNRVLVVDGGLEVDGKKVCPWKMQDRFIQGTCSGWVDLTIKTLTPLFIRGGLMKKNGLWDERETRLRPEPCTSIDGRPMIPGASLRGMIRTLVEILSFSKIKPVTNEKPFFRTVAADRIGVAYRARLLRNNQKPRGGYIRKQGNDWAIVPAAEVLRVHRDELNKLKLNVPNRPNPSYFPDWRGQHKSCWFRRDSQKNGKVAEISLSPIKNWEEGTLVLTGSAPNKKYDFVFVGEEAGKSIPIPEPMWRRFHDEDQITQWQEKAFPIDRPTRGCRKGRGHLREGEPVFFLYHESSQDSENPSGLVFFGRAQMFRFPYDLSPRDLVPQKIRNAGLDMAEALFGTVSPSRPGKEQAIKGRLFFEDALAVDGGPNWFEEIMAPGILASPKVTCFQHYLAQDGTKGTKNLTTYLNGDYTTIRGHKLYWHRWNEELGIEDVKESASYRELVDDLSSANPKDTQHTLMQPVRSGITFKGRIRFVNLTDIELGALLSALRLPDGCAHKIGMGKPLGLGSLKIDWTLHLVDRSARYGCWEKTGVTEEEGHKFMEVFEKAIMQHARDTGEVITESATGLQKIGRLQALFHILQWIKKPQSTATKYMPLDNFRYRPVLPTPHMVVGVKDPAWSNDPPRPAQKEAEPARSSAPVTVTVRTTNVAQAHKPVQKGQTRDGQLKRKENRWVASFEGETREAIIINPSAIPSEATEGSVAEFFITEQSKKAGIKARFEKLL
ncbi:TIGR03986 family type III CRISPR-associated RAMP protein [Desulfosoma sp.]